MLETNASGALILVQVWLRKDDETILWNIESLSRIKCQIHTQGNSLRWAFLYKCYDVPGAQATHGPLVSSLPAGPILS